MKKKMSSLRIVEVALLVFLGVLIPQLACATAPKSVDLVYDNDKQTLSVTIDHYTIWTAFHHIQYVEIKKNGKFVSKNEYDDQPTDELFTYTYKIPAVKGDIFEVTAICNMWGEKTSALTVP